MFVDEGLKTHKILETICQIEIHFSIKTTTFLMKYALRSFSIPGRLIIFLT